MNLDQLLQLFQVGLLLKIVAIILVTMVLIFTIVASRQTGEIKETLDAGTPSTIVNIVSYLNIILLLSLLLTAIVIL